MAASDKAVETRVLAATVTNQIVDWGNPPLKRLYVYADAANVRIDFDQPTDAGSFILPSATLFELNLEVNVLHASTSSSTANLYMIGIR